MLKTFYSKIIFFLLIVFNVVPLFSRAEGIEITPFAGYTFGDKFNLLYGGYGRISDGFTYGLILGKKINPNYSVELMYSRQEATGEYSSYDYYYPSVPISDYNIPLTVNYYQIGGCRLAPLGSSGKVEGYGGMNLGLVVVSPERDYSNKGLFAFGFKLGAKIWASDKIGLRLQANLQMPVQTAGISIYAGTGGASTGVSGFSTITQFGFTGGLVFRL